jgi:hypothetical protein
MWINWASKSARQSKPKIPVVSQSVGSRQSLLLPEQANAIVGSMRASKDPEDTSLAHAVSGNSLHNFVLENLFAYNEITGIGRTPSMAEEASAGSFDSSSLVVCNCTPSAPDSEDLCHIQKRVPLLARLESDAPAFCEGCRR